MKWGEVCKKVENEKCFVKKWTFPQRRVHYVQYQYFFILHFTYLGGGCVRTQRTPPLPTGLRRRKERKERGDGKAEPNG